MTFNYLHSSDGDMADPRGRLAVIVHGGAFSIPDEIAEACAKGCVLAAKEAYEVLRCGRSAIDAGVKITYYKCTRNLDTTDMY